MKVHYFSELKYQNILTIYFLLSLSLLSASCISDYTEDQKYIRPDVVAGGGEVLLPVAVANELFLEKERTKIDVEIFEEKECSVPHSLSQIRLSMMPVKKKYRENSINFYPKKRKNTLYFSLARGISYRVLAYHEAKQKELFEKVVTVDDDKLSLTVTLKCL